MIRRIDPIDGLVYILAQLSGGVLGALLTKAFLLDEGRASDYGTPKISALLGGAFQGFLVEGIGAFVLVLVVLSVALNPELRGPRSHRRRAGLARHGARPAHRRLVQPGPLVRPRSGQQPLHAMPGSTSSARWSAACLPRPSTSSSSSRGGRSAEVAPGRPRPGRLRRRSRPPRRPAGPRRRAAGGRGSRPAEGHFASLPGMRRVTFSRNYTLSLSRTCQCYCKYCAFATHRAHLHDPDEVERRLDEAVRRNAKELLVLTGERPEVNPEVAARLAAGATRTSPPTSSGPASGPRAGPAPAHQHRRPLPRGPGRLREVTASQGLMLESISERLMDTVHAGSPTKHPARRLETIELAGELKIPFTSGSWSASAKPGGTGRLARGARESTAATATSRR